MHYHIDNKHYQLKKRNIHRYRLYIQYCQSIQNIQWHSLNKRFLINTFKLDKIYILITNLNHMIHMQRHMNCIIHYIKFQGKDNWYKQQHLNKLNNLNYSFNMIHYLRIYQMNMQYKLLNYYKLYILKDKLNKYFHLRNNQLDMRNSIMNSIYYFMIIHKLNNQWLN